MKLQAAAMVVFLTIVTALIAGEFVRTTKSPINTDAGQVGQHRSSATSTSQDSPSPTPSPVVAPTTIPLSLRLNLPDELSDIQVKYKREALILPRCPLCFGVDKPALKLDDNALAAWVALLYTESSLNPYDAAGNRKVSSAGCVGLGQLCGSLLTDETRESDELNLYASAAEFVRLIGTNGGDLNGAIEGYKGVVTPDVKWQADSVWAFVRIGSGG